MTLQLSYNCCRQPRSKPSLIVYLLASAHDRFCYEAMFSCLRADQSENNNNDLHITFVINLMQHNLG